MERVCGLQWMKRKKRESIHERDDMSLNTLYVVECDKHRGSKGMVVGVSGRQATYARRIQHAQGARTCHQEVKEHVQ